MYTHVCVYICVYVYTYIHTYTYIYEKPKNQAVKGDLHLKQINF